jgi:hypothetical protein
MQGLRDRRINRGLELQSFLDRGLGLKPIPLSKDHENFS